MAECGKALEAFGIPYEERVLSAHRQPEETAQFARDAAAAGFKVIIAGAGMAAHLAGVVAAHTTLPVICVPLPGSALQGVDALLSMVQMPSGIPVATVAIGKAGAINAAILATEILALEDEELKKRLVEFRKGGSKLDG